jgi:hypothetical protein
MTYSIGRYVHATVGYRGPIPAHVIWITRDASGYICRTSTQSAWA